MEAQPVEQIRIVRDDENAFNGNMVFVEGQDVWVRLTNNDGGYEYVSLGKVDRETSRQKYIACIPVPNPDGPKKTKQVNVTGGPFYSALDAAVAAAKAMRDLPPLPKASRAPRGTKRERDLAMTGVHPEEWLHFRSVAGMAKCYELILMHGYEPNDALAATRHIVTPPPAGAPATPTTQAIGGARPQSGGIAFGGSPWGPAAQLGSRQPWGPVLNTTNSIAGATQYYSPVPPPPWDLHG